MKFLKEIINYLWKLTKSYIVLLGILPWVYDFLQAYLAAFLPFLDSFTLPKLAIYGILGLSFFISGFTVWRGERKRAEILEKKLDFKVQYEVAYSIEELQSIDVTEIEKQIQRAEEEEAKEKENDVFGIPSSTIALLTGIGASRQTNSSVSLKHYLRQVEKYNNQIKGVKRVILDLQNVGSKYDECIAVRVVPSESTLILNEEEVSEVEELPEHPSDRRDYMAALIPNINASSGNPHAFHREVDYSDDGSLDVEINRLRPTEEAQLVLGGLYVKSKYFSFDVEITSKNLSEPQKFTVTNETINT